MRYCANFLIVLSLLVLTACKTNLNFYSGAPYQTPYHVDESIIVTFPDEIKDRKYRVKVGGFLDSHFFRIPVQDAYSTEVTGRLGPMFARGVSVTNKSVYDQITPLNAQLPASRDESVERNLDAILEDLNKKEKKELETKKSESALTEEAFRAADLQSIESKQSVYLLRFNNALLGFVEGRARVSFQVELIDRRTGNILMGNQYQGRSQRFDPNQNNKTNEIVLVRLVRQAFAGAMSQMMDDIAATAGASGSKK